MSPVEHAVVALVRAAPDSVAPVDAIEALHAVGVSRVDARHAVETALERGTLVYTMGLRLVAVEGR